MERTPLIRDQASSQVPVIQEVNPFRNISAEVGGSWSPVRTGRRSYFTETWNQAIDMFNVANRTGNVAQGVLAVLKIMFLGLATIILVLPAISLAKSFNAKLSHASSAIGMTYHKTIRGPKWESQLEQGKGIIDRAYAQSSSRLSYGFVMDHTGHAKPDGFENATKYSDMTRAQEMIRFEIEGNFANKEFSSVQALGVALNQALKNIAERDLGPINCSGSFHMAIVAKVNGKKVVITVDAGDSTLWLVKKDGRVQKVTERVDHHKVLGNSFSLRVFEAEKGDRVVGTTDFHEYLSEPAFKRILAESGTADDVIHQSNAALRLIENPRGASVDGLRGKDHNPESSSQADDMGVFMLYV